MIIESSEISVAFNWLFFDVLQGELLFFFFKLSSEVNKTKLIRHLQFTAYIWTFEKKRMRNFTFQDKKIPPFSPSPHHRLHFSSSFLWLQCRPFVDVILNCILNCLHSVFYLVVDSAFAGLMSSLPFSYPLIWGGQAVKSDADFHITEHSIAFVEPRFRLWHNKSGAWARVLYEIHH